MNRTDYKIKQSRFKQLSERQDGMYGAMARGNPSEKAREIFNRPPFGSKYKGGGEKK